MMLSHWPWFTWKFFNSSLNFASFFIVMIHNSSVNFKLMHFLLRIKRSHQSPSFDIFQVFWWKCAIFIVSFWKAQVRFPSNFASIFSAIKHNFSVLSKLKHYMLWSKRAYQNANFLDFWVVGSKFVKFLMSILKRQVNSSSNLASSFFILYCHDTKLLCKF